MEIKLLKSKEHVNIQERPLGGDDVVWFSILVHQPGVSLDPLPAILLGEEPEHSQTALARLHHCREATKTQNIKINGTETFHFCRSPVNSNGHESGSIQSKQWACNWI